MIKPNETKETILTSTERSDSKKGSGLIKWAIGGVLIVIVALVWILYSTGVIFKPVSISPIDQFVTHKTCDFYEPGNGDVSKAFCTDGSAYNVTLIANPSNPLP
jgi:hypothetical protein